MKKLILTTLTVLVAQIQFAQDFQGMAVYQSKTQMPNINATMQGREITPEMRARMEERIKRNLEKKYILNFDKTTSIYKEEEKLDTPGSSDGGGMRMRFGQDGTLYKNVKQKSFTSDRDIMGKEFLIKDTLTTINWQLTQETKQIGDYLCFKATAKVPNQGYKFKEIRDKANQEMNKDKSPEEQKKSTNLLPEIKKENEVVAWYTPDIPVSNGPGRYQGLPGLILEVTEDKTIILCTTLVMNVKERKEIKEPTNGKVVSQKEFDDISKAKMQEMMDNFQRRGSNTPVIRMGN